MLRRLIDYIAHLFSKIFHAKTDKKKEGDKRRENNGPPDSIYPLW